MGPWAYVPAKLCLCIHLSVCLCPAPSPLAVVSLNVHLFLRLPCPQGGACVRPCVCVSLAGSRCQWICLYLPHPPPCSFIKYSSSFPLGVYASVHVCVCAGTCCQSLSPSPGLFRLGSGAIFCSLTTLAPMLPPALVPGLPPGPFPGNHPLDTSSSAPQNSTHLLYLPLTIQSPALDHRPWEAQPSLALTLSRHFIFLSPTSGPAHNPFSLVEEAPSPSPTIPGLSRLAPAARGTLTP